MFDGLAYLTLKISFLHRFLCFTSLIISLYFTYILYHTRMLDPPWSTSDKNIEIPLFSSLLSNYTCFSVTYQNMSKFASNLTNICPILKKKSYESWIHRGPTCVCSNIEQTIKKTIENSYILHMYIFSDAYYGMCIFTIKTLFFGSYFAV